jgi:hypothetical protein
VGRRIGEKSAIHLGRKEVITFKFQKKTIHYTKGVWWGCVCCEGVCIVG